MVLYELVAEWMHIREEFLEMCDVRVRVEMGRVLGVAGKAGLRDPSDQHPPCVSRRRERDGTQVLQRGGPWLMRSRCIIEE